MPICTLEGEQHVVRWRRRGKTTNFEEGSCCARLYTTQLQGYKDLLSSTTLAMPSSQTLYKMPSEASTQRSGWWRDAIVYQIWPKSFYSGRGSSTGDLQGIIEKIPYIKSLGANTIWVSPHYKSPMIDEGYDISDYESINPAFGDLADCERLIKEVHASGMRIIFDLVINHTSDQHKWFQESRSSKDNPKRDWYIWRPAKYDANGKRQPPNNWSSCFSQSAWTWDEHTQEYYLHLFAVEQPDLNWTNEETRKAIYKSAMEFWLERGVNGFRVDTVNMYSKPMDFPDAPVTVPGSDIQPASSLFCNGPEMHKYLREMGAILARYDAMTVGELPCTPDAAMVREYVGFSRNELSQVFQFDTVDLGKSPDDVFAFKKWELPALQKITEKWQTFHEGTDSWTTAFIENHDQGRSNSRFASDKPQHHDSASKMLAMMITCLSGTPYVYQGQEIGMTNVPLEWDIKEYLDLNTINYFDKMRREGKSDEEIEKAKWSVNLHARDNARTPVQWSDKANAGFTKEGVKPWMRVNDNYTQINVEDQLKNKNSVWHFWQKALALRKQHTDIFTYGSFKLLDGANKSVFGFVKARQDKSLQQEGAQGVDPSVTKAVVLLNFTDSTQEVKLPADVDASSAKVALSTYADSAEVAAPLQAYEGRLVFV